MSSNEKRKNRKVMTGEVKSTSMQKAVKVLVENPVSHPVYKKVIYKRKVYFARTLIDLNVGDVVEIGETRPLSKNIRWEVIRKIDK